MGNDSFFENYYENPKKSTQLKDWTTMTTPDNSNKLYEIKDGDHVKYGHKLAVNSSGNWVMEVKGTGEVISVDKSIVEEVLPHTISVQFDGNKTVYSYLAEKGSFEAGAFYIVDGNYGRSIAQVLAVDTKSKKAHTEFKPLAKLVTETI